MGWLQFPRRRARRSASGGTDRRGTLVEKTKVRRFLETTGIGFRNVYYIGLPSELADELRFDGTIPITIVYDAHGHELARNEGKLDVKWFRRMLTSFAKPKGGLK